nr:protein kinase [Actinomycetota bacterium]
VLMDRYELGELLGRGGMAEVYVGHDRVLGRRVAVKLLSGTGPRPEEAQRLRSEARAAASIEHPNVVQVYDLILTEEHVFVVMEYLEGETLRDRLRRETALAVEPAVRIGAQVCLALAAAHEAGVIHRDIGPGNIMLCAGDAGAGGDAGVAGAAGAAGDMVKVMDFGIARIAGNIFQTAPGQAMGTPAYLSPEQANGTVVDARSDLYSLGCTLYHVVTGEPPFTGATPAELAHQHCQATPRPPTALVPDLPAAIEAVILKAMAKDPDQRFDDALQMRAQLLGALEAPTHTALAPGGAVVGAEAFTATMAVPRDERSSATGEPGTAPAEPLWQALLDVDPAELDALEADDQDRARHRLAIVLIVLGLATLAVAAIALLELTRAL